MALEKIINKTKNFVRLHPFHAISNFSAGLLLSGILAYSIESRNLWEAILDSALLSIASVSSVYSIRAVIKDDEENYNNASGVVRNVGFYHAFENPKIRKYLKSYAENSGLEKEYSSAFARREIDLALERGYSKRKSSQE